MAGGYSVTFRDYGREVSNVRFSGADLTSGNIVAQEALMADILAALAAVSLGEVAKTEEIATAELVSGDPATSPFAQRENKWLVAATDNVTGLSVRFEIPCADLDQLEENGEEMELGANRTALISAIEAYALSVAGNAITVQNIYFVARNL